MRLKINFIGKRGGGGGKSIRILGGIFTFKRDVSQMFALITP